jgi:hypothetical protein
MAWGEHVTRTARRRVLVGIVLAIVAIGVVASVANVRLMNAIEDLLVTIGTGKAPR